MLSWGGDGSRRPAGRWQRGRPRPGCCVSRASAPLPARRRGSGGPGRGTPGGRGGQGERGAAAAEDGALSAGSAAWRGGPGRPPGRGDSGHPPPQCSAAPRGGGSGEERGGQPGCFPADRAAIAAPALRLNPWRGGPRAAGSAAGPSSAPALAEGAAGAGKPLRAGSRAGRRSACPEAGGPGGEAPARPEPAPEPGQAPRDLRRASRWAPGAARAGSGCPRPPPPPPGRPCCRRRRSRAGACRSGGRRAGGSGGGGGEARAGRPGPENSSFRLVSSQILPPERRGGRQWAGGRAGVKAVGRNFGSVCYDMRKGEAGG